MRCNRAIPYSLWALVICTAAGQNNPIQPVKIESGLLRGTVEDGLTVYRVIPYAAPPVGELRWLPPRPAEKWEGIRAAREFGRACMQTNAAIANLPAPGEDCLFVNVWTPSVGEGIVPSSHLRERRFLRAGPPRRRTR